MNPYRLRGIAFACLLAAIGFTVIFFVIKHRLWLANVAPYFEGPYDSVGSFAFQLAAFAGI